MENLKLKELRVREIIEDKEVVVAVVPPRLL
jgi:hypothetical protein